MRVESLYLAFSALAKGGAGHSVPPERVLKVVLLVLMLAAGLYGELLSRG